MLFTNIEKGLSNIFIINTLQKLNLPLFDGVFSNNNIPLYLLRKNNFLFICNTKPSHEKGEHFLLFYKKRGVLYIYDSLSLPLEILPKSLKIFLNLFSNIQIMTPNPIQSINSNYCGFYCIFFTLFIHSNPKIKLLPFSPSLINNDKICMKNIYILLKQYQ